MSDAARRALLAAVFESTYPAVMAYARRRTPELADAEDVVSETFVVAWRRLDELPAADDERRAWLFGVARRVLANQRRGRARRHRLTELMRFRQRDPHSTAGASGPAVDALSRLSDADQEVLRLRAWEGLTHTEVGVVLGITENAAAIRLHRARKRLAAEMGSDRAQVKGTDRIRTWLGWKGSAANLREREDAR